MLQNPLRSIPHAAVLLLASFAASLDLGSSAMAQCEPTNIGAASTPGDARHIAVSGATAYVVDVNVGFPDQGASRLNVIDVSNPANPMSLASLQTPGLWASDVAVSGTTVYVVDAAGVHVIDASEPTNPTILGSAKTASEAVGITVSGTTAYVAAGGLEVLDVSDPTNPTILGSISTPNMNSSWSVSVSGNRAYVAGYSISTASGWLHVIDISDPVNPTILGALGTMTHAYDVDIAGNFAYVAVHFNNDSGIRVIDISDPANPALVGLLNTAGSTWGVTVSGAIAYVADGQAGLQAIDVSDPANPTIFGSADLPGFAWGVSVSGSNAYVAASDTGFQVLGVQSCSVPGACCVNGAAVQLTTEECAAVGGVFHGSGVPSDEVECSPTCDADLTDDGVVDVFDLLELLGAWGTCK